METEEMQTFCESWHGMGALYEEYAKSAGFSYSSLYVLDILASNAGGCTQKAICEETFQPKQTVNAIIRGFLKQGIVELKEQVTDRRNKTVFLTKEGKKRAEKIFSKLRDAEIRAMNRLTSAERKALIRNLERFRDYFRESLRER